MLIKDPLYLTSQSTTILRSVKTFHWLRVVRCADTRRVSTVWHQECVLATPTKNYLGCWSLVLLFRLNDNRVVSSVTVLVIITSETYFGWGRQNAFQAMATCTLWRHKIQTVPSPRSTNAFERTEIDLNPVHAPSNSHITQSKIWCYKLIPSRDWFLQSTKIHLQDELSISP